MLENWNNKANVVSLLLLEFCLLRKKHLIQSLSALFNSAFNCLSWEGNVMERKSPNFSCFLVGRSDRKLYYVSHICVRAHILYMSVSTRTHIQIEET